MWLVCRTNKRCKLKMTKIKLIAFLCFIAHCHCGMLKPRESESRSIQEMNGMWMFRADMSPHRNGGMEEKWWEKPLSEVNMRHHGVVANMWRWVSSPRVANWKVWPNWLAINFLFVGFAPNQPRLALGLNHQGVIIRARIAVVCEHEYNYCFKIVILILVWASHSNARSVQLQWHHHRNAAERFRRMGVVWTGGICFQRIDIKAGSFTNRQCTLLHYGGTWTNLNFTCSICKEVHGNYP